MARFKIVTTGPGGSDHSLEMETLAAIGAEIVEVAGGDDELAKAVADADAIYAKGRPRITAKVIEAGKKSRSCRWARSASIRSMSITPPGSASR